MPGGHRCHHGRPSPSWRSGGRRRHHGRIPCVIESRGSPSPSWPAVVLMAPRVHRRHNGRVRVPSPSWPAAQCRRAPEGHRRHHGRLTPMAPRGSPATSMRYIHFSILSASGFLGTLSEMNASRRKTCSDDTCTNFSTADPVPAESSTSLDEIQRSYLVVQLIGHVSSVLGQGSLRHHVDELLLKGNWIPNHITVCTKGSLPLHVDELLLRRKRQDPKSDRCLD